MKYLFILLLLMTFDTNAQVIKMIHDINPGLDSSAPSHLTIFDGKLYFSAITNLLGRELWSYDETDTPQLVFDINRGNADGLNLKYIPQMASLNGKLYFSGNNGTSGYELMEYDGVNDPVMTLDINTGIGDSYPSFLYSDGSMLYFTAAEPIDGFEMRSYNPTSGMHVHPMVSGSLGGDGRGYLSSNGKILFASQCDTSAMEPFEYDPVTNKSIPIAIPLSMSNSQPSCFTNYNGKVYFIAFTWNGMQPYVYTNSKATMLKSTIDMVYSNPRNSLPIYKDALYYYGYDWNGHGDLYRFNFQTNTAGIVWDIYPGHEDSVDNMLVMDSLLYFTAIDSAHGQELWKYNGDTCIRLTDLWPGKHGSHISNLTEYNGKLYFTADDGIHGAELYSYMDTTKPPSHIESIKSSSFTIYPNPSHGILNIKFNSIANENVRIRITDLQGKEILSGEYRAQTGENDFAISIVDKPSNVYMITLQGNLGIATKLFVKQ